MFRKILICSDGSEGALTAARMGAQIAQKFHSAVLLIHTYDPAVTAYPAFGGGGWEFAASQDGLDAEAEAERRDMVEHTGQICRRQVSPTRPCSNAGIPSKRSRGPPNSSRQI